MKIMCAYIHIHTHKHTRGHPLVNILRILDYKFANYMPDEFYFIADSYKVIDFVFI